jgi:chromosome segregation ATPase
MPVASDPTQQLTNLSGKIEQWKVKRDKLAKILSTLEVDKNKTAASLRKLGANAEDIKSSDPKAATLLVELQDILRQIVNFDKKRIEYDLAIFKSESRLRTLERRLAALDLVGTDEELSALFSSIAEIDQELDAESANEIPVEFDELITKTLRDSTSGETGVVD